MSRVRDAILERIRCNKYLHKQQSASASVDEWMQQPTAGPQPHWTEDVLDRFIARLEHHGATLSRVSTDGIADEVVRFRAQHRLTGPLASAATPLLKNIDWPDELPVEYRAARAGDTIALSEAVCGMAETGSLVLRSGNTTPTTLNFLPEYFVCLLSERNIVNCMEDVWDMLRGAGTLPRAINMVTGPSRTADVEQTIQMGAHGPRYVHILLFDELR